MNSRRRNAAEGGLSCGAAQGRPTVAGERGAAEAPLCRWDDDLGRELRESPLPAHAPDHFERIRERMRKLTGPDGRPPAPPVRARPRRVPPAAARRRRGIRLAAVAAVAAAIVAAVAVTWSGVPGIRQSTPQPATADTVLARVQHALASLQQHQRRRRRVRLGARPALLSPRGFVHVHLARRLPHRAEQRGRRLHLRRRQARGPPLRVPRRQGPLLRGRPRPARPGTVLRPVDGRLAGARQERRRLRPGRDRRTRP